MKLAAIAALALCVACRDEPRRASGSGTAKAPSAGSSAAEADTAPPAPSIDVCELGARALDGARCANPEDKVKTAQAKQAIDSLIKAMASGNVGDAGQLQVGCARMLEALELDAAHFHCELALTADDRAAIAKLMERWYAQRTPVAPTGDPASDDVIGRIAALRDAMCACVDVICLDRIDKLLDTVGTLPNTAPPAARDLAGKLIDDIGRCGQRVKMGGK